jgi:predicted nucleic acid-binding protein
MTPVFLDTVGILALLERSDQWHADAVRVWTQLAGNSRPLLTTPLIFFECGNAVARKPYRARVDEIRREFLADGRLVPPSDADVEQAWASFARGEAGAAGIVDHISFQVMRRLGLAQAFTNDAHFRAAGFEPLF